MGKLAGVAFALIFLMLLWLTGLLMFHLVPYLWDEHRLLLIAVACGGVAIAAAWRLRPVRGRAPEGSRQEETIHPGISMHAIPISGGFGLLFALGYVVMFWFGVPGYRPIVLGVSALGAVFGVVLIGLRRRGRSRTGGTSILHLTSETRPGAGGADEPRKGPAHDASRHARGAALPARLGIG